MFIQCQVVVTFSMPWSKKMKSGIRLTANAVLTAALTCVTDQSWVLGVG